MLQGIILLPTLICCKEYTIDIFLTCWYARIATYNLLVTYEYVLQVQHIYQTQY